MTLVVTGFDPADRLRWTELWAAYLDFYDTVLPASVYEHTWNRVLSGNEMHGLAARTEDGGIVGITHYLFHAHGWTTARACYLQDLFVDDAARGQGAGRLLIEAVAERARVGGADRLYWTTQQTNTTARQLYDRLATNRGYVKYEYPLA